MLKGQIIKSTGGLYHVTTENGIFPCRPRGIFRKQGISPLVGDYVTIQLDNNEDGTINEIHDRNNFLIRPPIANLDIMVVVTSVVDPVPNYVVIDKFLATMESHNISAVIAITKIDLADSSEIKNVYSTAGYDIFEVNNNVDKNTNMLKPFLSGKLAAFAGNTGVGKSSMLNSLSEDLDLNTGETSKKLGRGKHTTRHVEIFELDNNIRIADTPGFSSMDILETTDVMAEDLDLCFIDFKDYLGGCKFNDCRHLAETGCAVKDAVSEGKIHPKRYESYKIIYDEIKDVKQWQRR